MAANDFCLPSQRWDLAAFLCFQRRNKSTKAAETRCREVNVRLLGVRYDLGAPAELAIVEARARAGCIPVFIFDLIITLSNVSLENAQRPAGTS
ncbi:hypothetical protein PG984_013764 [Apiospora sp. TS-2023a]